MFSQGTLPYVHITKSKDFFESKDLNAVKISKAGKKNLSVKINPNG